MNNQKKFKITAVSCLLLFVLSGCNKIIDWSKKTFEQSEVYGKKYIDAVQPYFRSTSIYNMLTSVADFTALLLTGDVRRHYVNYYAYRHMLELEQKRTLLRRLIDENKNFVSFYVSARQPLSVFPSGRAYFTGQYQKPGTLMGNKDAVWQVYLNIDGKEYKADHVKKLDLPLEYKHLFADRVSQFKQTYLVTFNLALDDQQLHDVSLLFRSDNDEATLTWEQIQYGFTRK